MIHAPVRAALRAVAHGARVENDDVRVFGRERDAVAGRGARSAIYRESASFI